MFRRGKWDLPKGKLDKGETIEDCALRETKEETGLVDLKLGKPITTTYHTYDESGKHILKETYWFLIRAKKENELIPQVDEQITKLEWAKPSALKEYTPQHICFDKRSIRRSRVPLGLFFKNAQ